jgi:hypothetical protein
MEMRDTRKRRMQIEIVFFAIIMVENIVRVEIGKRSERDGTEL